MSDLLGRRRVFLVGAALFAVGTFAGGIAPDGLIVIAARFVMGVGAAFSAPAALAIIVSNFPDGPHRNRALGIYTGLGATGYSMGVILGGLLTQIGWRWTFLAPVPLALTILIGGLLVVPRDRTRDRGEGGYDFGGAITITAGMLLIVYSIVQAPETGPTAPTTIGAFGLGVLSLALFAVIEKRVANPILPLHVLKVRSLVGASLVAAAILGTYMSFQFIGGLYLQSYRGWDPIAMAFGFLPIGLLIAALAPQMGKIITRFGVYRPMFVGFVAYTASYVLFLGIGDDTSYLWTVLPSLLLIGIAFPFTFPAANVLATSEVDESEHGLAAGILQTGYQVGAALVLALTTAAMAADHVGGDAPPTLDGYRQGLYVVIAISVVTAVATLGPAMRKRT